MLLLLLLVIFMAGGPIIWGSKTQHSVALSTCEAEYMAAGTCAREVLWLRHLLPELGFPLDGPTAIQCDNQACTDLIKNPLCNSKSKHIDIMHHFLRERVQRGELSVVHIPGDRNVADVFTKPVEGSAFQAHRGRLLQ